MRREDGFTLPEVLTACLIGIVVLLAAFGLLDSAVGLTSKVNERVDAIQRGRQAMDTITRDLRSQVCVITNTTVNGVPTSTTAPSLIAGSGTAIDLYVDLSDGSGATPPQRRTLTFDAGTRRITQTIYVPTGSPGSYVFPTTPTRSSVVLGNVVQQGATPVFQYFAYGSSTPLSAAAGLSSADRAKVVRILVTYVTRGTNTTTTTARSAVLQDEVYLRAADPNESNPTPQCPPQ